MSAKGGWVVLALLLAGCAGGAPDWTRPGADAHATALAYQDCSTTASSAVRTDADIDQDILASRQNDWQRSSVVRLQTQAMHDHTRDRADAILAACMKSKGFTPAR
jgi:hypothetical protein